MLSSNQQRRYSDTDQNARQGAPFQNSNSLSVGAATSDASAIGAGVVRIDAVVVGKVNVAAAACCECGPGAYAKPCPAADLGDQQAYRGPGQSGVRVIFRAAVEAAPVPAATRMGSGRADTPLGALISITGRAAAGDHDLVALQGVNARVHSTLTVRGDLDGRGPHRGVSRTCWLGRRPFGGD